MKTTKFNKLSLNKHTVANLSNKELSIVKGGETENCDSLKCATILRDRCLSYLPDFRFRFTCPITSNNFEFDYGFIKRR